MKKLRKLLVVTTLLMVFSFILPVGQGGAAVDEGVALTICSNCPPVDTFGFW